MYKDSKPRYELLDGLRGVAALMVIVYHCFECFPVETWIIGHGYLAVDFFFILSGFVIGYAYDDRWKKKSAVVAASTEKDRRTLTLKTFFLRRLIRLHPMVVFGIVVGVVTFLIQGSVKWDGSHVALSAIMLAVLLHLFMLPETPGAYGEVRGNGEMFPLNGPHWSLFFEYIGNILYAFFLRRLSTKVLSAVVVVIGLAFAVFALSDAAGYGNIGVGWTLDGPNFLGGMLRMLFPYCAGLLISRLFVSGRLAPLRLKGAFWICSLLIIGFLSVPTLGMGELAWRNCLYEVMCVLFLFPFVVYLGASGVLKGGTSSRTCSFLGEISYPLYAVHYPTMYLFYAYIGFPETFRTPAETWPWMIAIVVGNVVLAYLAMRFYDRPIRRYLAKKCGL